MRILIVGDGETGGHLAAMLSEEDQDVILLGRDPERLADLDFRLNIMTICGKTSSPSVLSNAGAPEADLFIAVTPDEYVNVISCQIARSMGASKTVARIENPEYVAPAMQKAFAATGIDQLVCPEYLAADEIVNSMRHNCFYRRELINHAGLLLLALNISKGERLDGMELRDFGALFHDLHVVAIRRGPDVIIPHGVDSILAGDIVYFSSLENGEQSLEEIHGCRRRPVRKVIVAGAGKIARHLAGMLSGRASLTIIDSDKELCRRISQLCTSATVVCSDPRNLETLRDEGIASADAFVALMPTSEANIVACMLARAQGVPFTVAEIEDTQYFAESQHLDIDFTVNKKLITAGKIFQSLLDNSLNTPRCLAFDDAEVIEIVARDGSRITSAPVAKLSLPENMTIAGLVRGSEALLVDGHTHILPGDHVILFCLRGALEKIRRLFS